VSVRVQTYVWQLDLPPSHKLVAIALADHCHDDGSEARPSQALLARKTGLEERSVRRILHALVEAGVIRLQRQATAHRANCYTFNLPDDFATLKTTFRGDTVSAQKRRRGDKNASRGDTVSGLGGTQCPPNHKKPSLEPASNEKLIEPADMEAVRKRNREIFSSWVVRREPN
jgi:Helix-turn-helix domain